MCASLVGTAIGQSTSAREERCNRYAADAASPSGLSHDEAYQRCWRLTEPPEERTARLKEQTEALRRGAQDASAAQAAELRAMQEKWRQENEARAARAKLPGIRIGMTKQQVLASSWGPPDDVNTTITAAGTHEQWVYGVGRYLYFDHGVLTVIQK